MSDLRARVSYLQGLAEGMDLSKSAEGRLLNSIIDVLNEFADSVEELEDAQEDTEEYLETLDEDLLALEGEVYGDAYWDDEDLVEVKCPQCGEIVCFDSGILVDDDVVEVSCPNCDEIVFISDNKRGAYRLQDKDETFRAPGKNEAYRVPEKGEAFRAHEKGKAYGEPGEAPLAATTAAGRDGMKSELK